MLASAVTMNSTLGGFEVTVTVLFATPAYAGNANAGAVTSVATKMTKLAANIPYLRFLIKNDLLRKYIRLVVAFLVT
jgi:hypothetical protein